MTSAHNLVPSELLQARAVGLPIGGAGSWNATVVVEVYALGSGVTLEREAGALRVGQGAFEVEAAGRRFVVDPLTACKTEWFVPPIQGDVAAIGQELQAVDEKDLAQVACGAVGAVAHGHSPVAKTAILDLPQGLGKTTLARAIAARIGCTRIVEDWWPTEPMLAGALHLTSADVLGVGEQGGAA